VCEERYRGSSAQTVQMSKERRNTGPFQSALRCQDALGPTLQVAVGSRKEAMSDAPEERLALVRRVAIKTH
jgi:hypothetical protein